MVKQYKGKNPLDANIPSKIYRLCYAAPKIQKELAKEIYGDRERQGYISRAINDFKMKDAFLIPQGPGGYSSNVQPLIDRIEKNIQPLTRTERKKLLKFLDGPFRTHVHPQGGLGDFATAWEYFRFTIGFRALLAWHQTRYHDIELMNERKKKDLLQDNRIAPFIILGKNLNYKLAHLLPTDFRSPLDVLILQRDMLRDMLRLVKFKFPKTKAFIDKRFEEAHIQMGKLSKKV